MKVLVINGPNINMLGVREPDVYGKEDYNALGAGLENKATALGIELEIVQSNSEGTIIDYIQDAHNKYDGIIINPGAYTHYSYAISDAIKAISVPVIEVHLSNIHSREEFRRKSVTAEGCKGQISGLGFKSYYAALAYFAMILEEGNL